MHFNSKLTKAITLAIVAVCLSLASSPAVAGYSIDRTSTTSGGGTWGSILRMTATLNGSDITFNVTKQSGTFSTSGTMYLKVGTYEPWGANRASRFINAGSSGASFTHDLEDFSGYPKFFYGRYESSNGGFAWVGPIKVSFTNGSPSPPTISGSPSTTYRNTTTSVTVYRGSDPDGDQVKVQCTATNSNRTDSSPYVSSWSNGGGSTNASFVFNSNGTQTIYCTTFDVHGAASSTRSRTISVNNRSPSTPTISSSPSSATQGQTTSISVWRGSDPDSDQVKVQCTATNSNRTDSSPYISSWSSGGSSASATFVFSNTGTQTIYCTTFDTFGAASSTRSRTISVVSSNQPPTQPTISGSPSSTTKDETTSVAVWRGTDPNGDSVKVECTATASNRTDGSPYISSFSSGGSSATASFVFNSTGTQTIYCTSFDPDGAASSTRSRTILVQEAQPTISNVSVNSTSVGAGDSQTVSWSSSNQSWYMFFLYNEAKTQPINTLSFQNPECAGVDPNGNQGCLGHRNPSTNRSATWTIPQDLDPGTYTIKVAIWSSDSVPADGDFSSPFSVVDRSPTISNVSVNSTSVGAGDSQTVSWSSSNQSWYMFFLYNEAETQPINTLSFQNPECAGVDPNGNQGCLGHRNPSSNRSATWTIPQDLDPGIYTIKVAIWSSDSVPADGDFSSPFSVVDRSPTISNVSVSSTSVGAGDSQTVSWSSSNQSWYMFYLYNEAETQPINTLTFQNPECTGVDPDGSEGCLGHRNPSTNRSATWAIPQDLDPGTYTIKVAIWSSDSVPGVGDFSSPFSVVDRNPTISNVAVSSTSVGAGDSQTVSWSSSNQSWYMFFLYNEAETQPINTLSFQNPECAGVDPNGNQGCLGHRNPSTSRSATWTIPQDLDPGTYTIKVAVWSSDSVPADGDFSGAFEVTLGQPSYLNVSEWAQAAAHYLVENDVLDDPPNHDLRGIFDTNRAEVATMLYRAFGGGKTHADGQFADWYGGDISPLFSDVADPDVWYFKPASYLGRLAYQDDPGAVTVFNQSPCIFRSSHDISRAWILKALLEVWNVAPLADFDGIQLFDDVPTSHEAAGYIYAARQLGLVDNSSNFYQPNEPADREVLFVLLHRILESSANLIGDSIDRPTPQENSFIFGSRCSQIGHRFEQPILAGIQTPATSILATVPQPEDLGTLKGIYTSTLEAQISGLDPGTYIDVDGNSHQASPFCAWTASRGSFIDLDPGASRPFCRVKWVAPTDVSQASGSDASYTVTLFVGDGLGSEVRAQTTLRIHAPTTSSEAPIVTIDPLPFNLMAGQRVEVTGTVVDGGDQGSPDIGILEVALRYSVDDGSTWFQLGSATLVEGERWFFEWFVPQVSGALQVEAIAINLRANPSEPAFANTSVTALLSIQGTVGNSQGQSVENASVHLSGPGLSFETLTDNLGSFRFSSAMHGLLTETPYMLTASHDGRMDVSGTLVLTQEAPELYSSLTLDTAAPSTEPTVLGGEYSTPQTVELICSDDRSGCSVTYFSVDGSPPTTDSAVYSDSIQIASSTTLQFFSIDEAGNMETIQSEIFSISACTFELDTPNLAFSPDGGTATIGLSTAPGCPWDTSSNVPWVSLTPAETNMGSGVVELIATANPGPDQRVATVTIAGISVIVTQAAPIATYSLTVAVQGSGNGHVVSNFAGIDCGTDCDELYVADAEIVLTAIRASDSTFLGWSGDCSGTGDCILTFDSDKLVLAEFGANDLTLSVTAGGSGSGTVTSNLTGIDCGLDCSEAYPPSTFVTLSALADTGSIFTGWSGAGCIGTEDCIVEMNQSQTIVATFDLDSVATPTISVLEPSGNDDSSDRNFRITWEDGDPTSEAWINLYYDTDASGADGTLIASRIKASSTTNEHTWWTRFVPEGEYFIYGVIDNGVDLPLVSYSTASVQITHQAPITVCGSGCDYTTLQNAIAAAGFGDRISVGPGVYPEVGQIVIDKDLTIQGAGEEQTVLQPSMDTSTSGDGRGWWLVTPNVVLDLGDLSLDGAGFKVYQGIRHRGEGLIQRVAFENLAFNPSGPQYAGSAVVAFGTGPVDVLASTFDNIGRLGVLYYGTGVNGSIASGNTYVGKGLGMWLDYGIEVGNGAVVEIVGNTFANNRSLAAVEAESAGVLVSTYFGSGTEARVAGNTFMSSDNGITVGYDEADGSLVTAHDNYFSGNTWGVSSSGPVVDARKSFWGDASGPIHSSHPAGQGDAVSDAVDFIPYLGAWSEDLIIQTFSPVDIIVTMNGLVTSKTVQEIPGSSYAEADFNGDGEINDRVTITNAPVGFYEITIVADATAVAGDTYSLTVEHGSQYLTVVSDAPVLEQMDFEVVKDEEQQVHIVEDSGALIQGGFDEGNGSSTSLGGLDGTLEGGAQWGVGQSGSGLDLDGTGYVSIPDPGNSILDLTEALTVAVWVRPSALNGTQILVSKDPAYELEIGKIADNVYDLRLNNIIVGSGATPVKAEIWQHLAATWDGTKVRYYYNGVFDGEAPFDGVLEANDSNLGIGARADFEFNGGPVFFFHGLLDDVSLFDYALTPGDIAVLVGMSHSDTTPPSRTDLEPAHALPLGSNSAQLALVTDEVASCRYSADRSVDFDQMSLFEVTDAEAHSQLITGLADHQVYTFYVRCEDSLGNTNADAVEIAFGIDNGVDIFNGLAAYWAFDEENGCVVLDAVGTFDGLLSPQCPDGSPIRVAGIRGNALVFSGGDQEVLVGDVGALSSVSQVTLSAWIRHDAVFSYRSIIDQRDSQADGYDLYLSPSSKLFLRFNSETHESNRVVADGTWHHVAAVVNDTEIRLYVDGMLDSVKSASVSPIDTTGSLHLGKNFANAASSFTGTMDEVLIHTRALTDVEVLEVYLATQ